jgi:hypothetical protein
MSTMSCCGNKRKQWLKEAANPEGYVTSMKSVPSTSERKSRLFEYTGKHSKKVIGANTGRTYYFRFTGHRLIIPYEDTFGMMAESDLNVISK